MDTDRADHHASASRHEQSVTTCAACGDWYFSEELRNVRAGATCSECRLTEVMGRLAADDADGMLRCAACETTSPVADAAFDGALRA